MKNAFIRNVSLLSMLFVWTSLTAVEGQQKLGTSCADCPNYSGSFSIENETGVTIPYQVKWGEDRPWKQIHLASGRIETHSYPLGEKGNAKAPAPYVRFDRIGGDGKFTAREYHMQFYLTGYAGFGAERKNNSPKRYFFKYAPDGKTLDLLAR